MKAARKAALGLIPLILASSVLCGGCRGTEKAADSREPGVSVDRAVSDTRRMKLTWFVPVANDHAYLPPTAADFVKRTIDEKFNVDWSVEYAVSGPEYADKISAKLSAREYPDLFVSTGTDSVPFIVDGLVHSLDSFVSPQTMPNYYKLWLTREAVERYQTSGMFARLPLPLSRTRYISYYVRKDWLDKLGLAVPQTYADMIGAMRAFVERDPDGNGKNDTYGMSGAGSGTTIVREFPEFYDAGLIGGSLFVEGDRLIDSQSDVRNEIALAELKRHMEMGLYDPNWFLNKPGNRDDKIVQGKVGIFYTDQRDAALDGSPSSYQNRTKAATGERVDWQPFHPWKKSGVATITTFGLGILFPRGVPAEHVERSIRILDWLSSQEGFVLTHFGLEGVHYNRSGDDITLLPDAFTKTITEKGDFLSIYRFFTPDDPGSIGLRVIDPRETKRDRAILAELQTYAYRDGLGTNVTLKPGMDLAGMRARLNMLQAKIIFEEADTANWRDYRRELMLLYGGQAIFELYAQQVGAVSGRKLAFQFE